MFGALFIGDPGLDCFVWCSGREGLDDCVGHRYHCMWLGGGDHEFHWDRFGFPHSCSTGNASHSHLQARAIAEADSATERIAQVGHDDGDMFSNFAVVMFTLFRGDDGVVNADG